MIDGKYKRTLHNPFKAFILDFIQVVVFVMYLSIYRNDMYIQYNEDSLFISFSLFKYKLYIGRATTMTTS